MTRPRGLSLRYRMLILLIGVTSAFLLIMGTVSTVVLDNHLYSLFRQNLQAEGASTPSELSSNYLAVKIIPRTAQVILVTKSPATQALAEAVTAMGTAGLLAHLGDQPFTLQGPGNGPEFGAVARRLALAEAGGPAGPVLARPVLVVAQPVSGIAGQVRGLVIAELITGGALIALLAIGGEWLIGRGLDPLQKMTVTANEITSRGDLTARMPNAGNGTEVGSLGSAINTMLDRIQQAFGARHRSEQRVREFAADASHELRTPLTTIRGYAELYRQGALGQEQLPNAMRRIEQEAQRMSTLVAELLELARLDRISSLDLAETDLAAVVRDAVADAVAVEPRRPVRAEAPPRLVAVVDERRIRQVLANLLGNVRAHTPATAAAAVRLGQVTGGILIEVADAGPGMSAEDAARAFDRFHRAAERRRADLALDARDSADGAADPAGPLVLADNGHGGPGEATGLSGGGPSGGGPSGGGPSGGGPSGTDEPGTVRPGDRPDGAARRPRSRDLGSKERATGGGSGLGLSIVQAIAAAHGGQATLESWPAHGTRVRIWLPDREPPG
jgi:signal transduction histidine kinase